MDAARSSRLLLLLTLVVAASAQFGGKPPDKPKSPASKADIKFIRCQVCEAMAKQARDIIKAEKELAAGKKIQEADVLEGLERMCNPEEGSGDWITRYDISEGEDELKLYDVGSISKCKVKCRTIARACEQLQEEIDLTDLSAMLVGGKKRAAVSSWMCYESTNACSKRTPPLPADRRKINEPFQVMSEDEVKAQKMMRSMRAAGMSGTMYDRETMAEQMAEMKEQYEDMGMDFSQAYKGPRADGSLPDDDAQPDGSLGTLQGGAGQAGLADTLARAAEAVKARAGKAAEDVKGLAAKLVGEEAVQSISKAAGGVVARAGKVAERVRGYASKLADRLKGGKAAPAAAEL